MIGLGDLQRGGAVAVFFGQTCDLVVEDIGQPLEKQQRQEVILELGGVLLAPDGAGGVPQHLLHGFRRGGGTAARAAAAPPRHARRRFRGLRGRIRRVDPRFGGQRGDGFPRRLLRHDRAAFPAVHAGEGNAEPSRELLLREIKVGANGAQRSRDGS